MNGFDFAGTPYPELPDFGDPNISKQANQIWKMLDEMAEKNPSKYKNFINEQLKQGREASSFVKSWMCLQTTLQGDCGNGEDDDDDDDDTRLPLRYVNFCTSEGVKEPQGETVPLVISKERRHYDDDKDQVGYYVYDVIVSAKVRQRAVEDSTFFNEIIQLGLNCVDETFSIKLSKIGYKLFQEEKSDYKGPFTWSAGGKEISHPPRPVSKKIELTPTSLLADLRGEQKARIELIEDEGAIALPSTSSGSQRRNTSKPLIEVIGDKF